MNQLPFSNNSFMSSPLQVDVNNLPVTPQVNVPVELQQYYPLIIATAIDQIQGKANLNSLRVFLFNQCIINQYNNQQFTALIEYCVKVIDAKLLMRHESNPQAAINNLVPTCVTHLCAYNLVTYPLLSQSLANHEIQAAHGVMNELQQMQQYIMTANQPRNTFAQTQPFNNHFNQQNNNSGNSNIFSSYNAPANNGNVINRFGNNSFNSHSFVSPSASGVFNSGTNINNITNNKPNDGFSNYSVKANNTDSVHIANIQAKQNEQINKANIIDNPVIKNNKSNINWIPSDKYPVICAFDPNTHFLEFVLDAQGKVKPQITTKETAMNIEDHLFQLSYNVNPSIGVTKEDTRSRLYDTTSSISADNDKLSTQELPVISLSEDNKGQLMDTSIKDVSFSADIALRKKDKTDNKLNVARKLGSVIEPLVTNIDITPFLNKLSLANSLTQIQTELRIAKKELEEKQDCLIDNIGLTFLNNRISKIYNDSLSNNLCLPFGHLDSFIDEYGDSLTYIGKKYGDNTVKSFLANEHSIINHFLNTVSESGKQDLDEDYGLDQNSSLYTNYFSYNYTLTSIDLYSAELKMDMHKPKTISEALIANGVTESLTPLFYSIVENCLLHREKNNLLTYRIFIKTLDGVYFEITNSYINSELPLVSIYK